MNKILVNTSYLGPVSYYASFVSKTEIIIEANENYQKKSFRNKCQIFGSQGVEILSVPLTKGKHNAVNIRDVEIAYNDNWMVQHLKRLKEAYAKAPYFIYYFEELKEIISSEKKYLYDLNMDLLKWTLRHFQIPVALSESHFFYTTPLDMDDYRLNFRKIINQNIERPYNQVYTFKHGFQSNLSSIDLLMNQGPESIQYLKEINKLMTI